jgi:alkaline phosphatase D
MRPSVPIGQTVEMEPVSRRLFLAGSAAIVVAACSGDDPSPAAEPTSSTPSPAEPTSTASSAPTSPTEPAEPAEPGTAPPPTTTTAPVTLDVADPFTLGVASGDPATDSVVLWTRLAPDPLQGGGMPPLDVEVTWEVATDDAFTDIVATGTSVAVPAHAHSVHAVATFDQPVAGPLQYRFRAGQYTSPTGTTRLAPAADDPEQSCTFVSASCQHFEAGHYVAHRDIAARRPDFLVWLGDYIYEGGQGVVGQNDVVRTHVSPEVTTLDDYRNRYALYKGDPDLQAAHAACPWMVTWDDHEVENNYAGDVPQDAGDAATFAQRRFDAYQAWWEHQPVALPPPTFGQDYPIYRSFQWGSVLTMAVLDGRQYRSDQTCGGQTLNLDPACPETFDPARTMLGEAQEQWLFDVLGNSTSTWNVIAQQTIFGDVMLGEAVLNYDQWDGYPVQRNRIIERIAADGIDNVVVLTGDIHFAGTGVIRAGERGVGTPVATEFTTTSISSGGRINPAVTEVVRAIPDIIDVELEHRGYIAHTVTAPAWQALYRMADTVKLPESAFYQHAVYQVDAGTNLVRIVEGVQRGG